MPRREPATPQHSGIPDELRQLLDQAGLTFCGFCASQGVNWSTARSLFNGGGQDSQAQGARARAAFAARFGAAVIDQLIAAGQARKKAARAPHHLPPEIVAGLKNGPGNFATWARAHGVDPEYGRLVATGRVQGSRGEAARIKALLAAEFPATGAAKGLAGIFAWLKARQLTLNGWAVAHGFTGSDVRRVAKGQRLKARGQELAIRTAISAEMGAAVLLPQPGPAEHPRRRQLPPELDRALREAGLTLHGFAAKHQLRAEIVYYVASGEGPGKQGSAARARQLLKKELGFTPAKRAK